MTIAEIHGKISSGNLSDRLEDLLTSDVFGPLRYLPFTEGLLCVLGKAQLYTDPDTTFYAKFGKNLLNEPKVIFWPRTGRSEPDALIEFDHHLVMVEAKYLSGKSGDFDPENAETASYDQLAREFRDLLDYQGDFSDRTLIYLTAHSTLPEEDLDKSRRAMNGEEGEEKFRQNTYWLSWFEIRNAVEELLGEQKDQNKKLVLDDIKRLLHRKGFRKFEGFEYVGLTPVCSLPKTIFYQPPRGKFGGFDILLMKSNPIPENAFYLRSN